MRISDGCDYRCAFCTIPAIRGDHASRPVEDIVSEARELAAEGTVELVLVAQDSMRYGWDLYGKLELPRLLRELAKVDGILWIRLMYAFPATVTDAVIEVMATEPKICKYLDIPLQHANRAVLKQMNRPGDGERYLRILERFRSACPEIAVRSTFIVGHPGETPAAFDELKQFLAAAQLDRVGVFTFCREEGTPSADLPGLVPKRTAERRRQDLMRTQAAISREKNGALIGTSMEVLCEERASDGMCKGRTYRDAPEIDGTVMFACAETKPGEIVPVRMTAADVHDLTGERVLAPA